MRKVGSRAQIISTGRHKLGVQAIAAFMLCIVPRPCELEVFIYSGNSEHGVVTAALIISSCPFRMPAQAW